MPSKRPLSGLTAYELRKKTVEERVGKAIFEREFALQAFAAGFPGRKNIGTVVFTEDAVDHLVRKGHADLGRSCLAYLLSTESGHDRLEESGFLTLIRKIRDAALTIRQACDELTDQLVRHVRETGQYEHLRGRALFRMAVGLHGGLSHLLPEGEFGRLMEPQPFDNPLADGQWTHGLMSCGALYNAADEILQSHDIITNEMRRNGLSVMNSGNRADHERDAFIRDLAEIYETVFDRKPSARDGKGGEPSPFMRFVIRVFGEFSATHEVDPKRYRPPSSGTVRAILQVRSA